ncbi:MAG: hypothetical protein QW231_02715, partial [Candidatus Bathyarchaeia archaeon]
MKILRLHFKTLRLLVFLTMLSLPNLIPPLTVTVTMANPASTSGSYFYKFVVDENGFTQVTVDYSSSANGYSWVFVPNFTGWNWKVSSGVLLHTNIVETARVTETNYYFYRALNFSFNSHGSFEMRIQFNMSTGALIIEPQGIFFSPQIGFKEGSSASAEVFLPEGYRIVSRNALALGSSSYLPDSISQNYARFNLRENLIRLQIEFSTEFTKPMPEVITLTKGSFTFNAVKRYEVYASDILDLFDRVYDDLIDLFNVTLENVEAQFFIPDFDAFLSLGGYVPFTGGKIGTIHINVAFTRYIKGVLEVIALHELIHHFLWKTGISPDDLLWFHEGMAQYVSMESIMRRYPPGHEGASYEKDILEENAAQINKSTGGNFNFLLQWKPGNPEYYYYPAAYYVTSRLAERYGGLKFYTRFFELIKRVKVRDNDLLTYYLSLAANASVAQTLQGWGLNVADFRTLTEEAREAIDKLNPMFQPYKSIAEYLYQQALIKLEEGNGKGAS